jgi:exonuclease SbcC
MSEILKETGNLSEQCAIVMERKRQAETSLEEVRHQRAELKKELEDIRLERASRYGTRDPDQEEKAITDSLRVAEQIAMENRKACELAEKDFHEHTVRIEALQSSLIARTERIRSAETDFVNAREGEGFADEESFLAACLPGTERLALQAASDDLEQRQAGLQARSAEIQHQMEQEEVRALTDQSAAALREEITAPGTPAVHIGRGGGSAPATTFRTTRDDASTWVAGCTNYHARRDLPELGTTTWFDRVRGREKIPQLCARRHV